MSDLAQARSAVADFLEANLNEDQLFEKLGVREKVREQDPALVSSYSDDPAWDAKVMGPLDDVRSFGRIFFKKLNTQCYGIACGSDTADTEERKQLMASFGFGKTEVAAALAALLVAQLALAPAVATVVALLIVKLVFRNALGAMCEVWKSKIS
ncbi:MAG: hypothetical protein QOE96_201 [Blastocatellia bacterium]|nr:hypothetical protein [Blastocatellia bacterium]